MGNNKDIKAMQYYIWNDAGTKEFQIKMILYFTVLSVMILSINQLHEGGFS